MPKCTALGLFLFMAKNYKFFVNRYPATKNGKIKAGTVYLIKNESGYYKIGRTKGEFSKRLAQLQSSTHEQLSKVAIFVTSDHEGLELYLHTKFDIMRVRGEWFRLNDMDVERLISLAKDWLRDENLQIDDFGQYYYSPTTL